ncbi:3-oxoacyl-ACP synthase [Olleya sp. UBA1516]|uniref:3-oxoacyl-ACP synthase n=1 Tax=Olleya sp. UBA1516 TaxID=1947013 RepID=UPI0025E892E9|nr:3-oxoacyl-ACP synthase [Olleya sp. UBA1516]|tara:strand:- start:8400 stop:8861 length:462 start_codon:yes stop_codon:yes gene_type:complete
MNSTEKIKQALHDGCALFTQNRLDTINKTISELQESLTSETKSSAGDKHETGRAMVQLEREKAGHQLAQIQKVNQLLAKISTEKTSEIIGLGSVVYTTKANYYIAISAGELEVDAQKFYAIAANTPIAQLLLGKTIGDDIVFRAQNFSITNVN